MRCYNLTLLSLCFFKLPLKSVSQSLRRLIIFKFNYKVASNYTSCIFLHTLDRSDEKPDNSTLLLKFNLFISIYYQSISISKVPNESNEGGLTCLCKILMLNVTIPVSNEITKDFLMGIIIHQFLSFTLNFLNIVIYGDDLIIVAYRKFYVAGKTEYVYARVKESSRSALEVLRLTFFFFCFR